MKATVVNSLTAAADLGKTNWLSVILDLTKFRLTSLVLLTTLVGFYIGEHGGVRYGLLLNTLLGTGLVAGGAAALNQLLEKEYDALMKRTRSRPLPAGRMQPETVLIFGIVTAVVGLIQLALVVNPLTAALGAITLFTYVCVYTPLKRVTPLNTVVGAVPGALPPLMGWAAARNAVTSEGWALFGILFFWQLPHFMAIAWVYREEYARAGFAMLSVYDPEGIRTGRQAVASALGLLLISLCPFVLHVAGAWYCLGALVLGGALLALAVQFSFRLTREHARRLFYGSILYLPMLLGLLVFDKVR